MRFFNFKRSAAVTTKPARVVMIEAVEARILFTTTGVTTTSSAIVMSAVAVPIRPTGLIATATSSSQIALRWNAAATATGYTLERSTDGTTFSHVTNLTATTYTNTGLTAGKTYIYRVKAYNAGGSSTPSSISTATTFGGTTSATSSTTTTTTTTTTVKTATTTTTATVQPSARNTGILAGTVLKAPVYNFKAASNTTYTNMKFIGQVTATGLTNVKFVSCYFEGNGNMYNIRCDNASNVTISNCELVGGGMASIWGDGFTATANYIHRSTGDGFKLGRNVVIKGNYITELGWGDPDAHADGVQIRDGYNITISGNYFDMPNDVYNTKSNAAMFLQLNTSNVTFSGNWVRGGNYTIHAYSDLAGGNATIKITGNIFYSGSSRFGFGHIGTGVVWSNNLTDKGTVALTSSK